MYHGVITDSLPVLCRSTRNCAKGLCTGNSVGCILDLLGGDDKIAFWYYNCRKSTAALFMMQNAEEGFDFQWCSVSHQCHKAACLSKVLTCDIRPPVSDALGRRDQVYIGSICVLSRRTMVLFPGTSVLLPHQIQTPTVTLPWQFVTSV